MKIDTPFLKLPIRFDPDSLAAEVRALPPTAWSAHPTGFVGNEAVRLVSPGGQQTDDFSGPMGPTAQLGMCPYIREIMAEIGGVWGRSRLMGLAAGAEVPAHIDTHYYWRTHLRLHIPVITNPGVLFTCDNETVHMAAGECWAFDSFRMHRVENKGSEQRVHLVLDTVGGGNLPALIMAAQSGVTEARLLRPGDRTDEGLRFEKMNSPSVMSPWEMRCHVSFLRDEAQPHALLDTVLDRLDQFVDAWAATWAEHGSDAEARLTYGQLLDGVRRDLNGMSGQELKLRNGWPLYGMLEPLIFQMALGRPEGGSAPINAGQSSRERRVAHL